MIEDSSRTQPPPEVRAEAGARLRAAFDNASTGLTVVDDSGRYVEVNRAFAELLGYRVDELLGRHFGEVTLAGEHDSDVAMMGELISGTRRSVVREKQYRHRDGTLLVALVSSYLVQQGDDTSWQLLSTIESLTEERAAQQRLIETRTAADGIVTLDDTGIVVAWNHGAERVFGHPAADMLGRPLDRLVPPRLRAAYAARLGGLLAGDDSLLGRTVEVAARHADGRELLTELSLSTWQHDGHPRFTAIARDVTVKRRAEQAAALIRHAAVTANSANSFIEAAAEVVRQVCTRLGWLAGQAWTAGGGPVVWHVGDHPHATPGPASGCGLRLLAERGSAPTEQQLAFGAVARVSGPEGLRQMGPAVPECGIGFAVAVPVLAGGEVTGMLGFYLPADCPAPEHDLIQALEQIGLALGRVVERQRTSEALAWQATHDPVTDLANRRLLLDHIRRIRQADGRQAALLLINLDRFRLINDALGYALGDQVLRLAGDRLRAAVGAEDLVARLSADEFVVVATMPGTPSPAGSPFLPLADRLLHELRQPLAIGGHELMLRASVGIRAVTGDDPDHFPAAVLRDADAALRQAKNRGKDQVVVFDGAMAGTAKRRMDDEIALARAITDEQLVLHYQPIIALDTGRPVGAEALVRWHRPGHGMQAPDRFIPMAEESGLIVDLGRWVLHQACRDAAGWPHQAPIMADASVSVNVSARQLTHPRFLADLQTALAETGLAPERLILEITETALISEPEAAMETLHAVRACGVQLALDDFGTGYSSLSYVQKLPATILKIDKSFVDPISGPGAGTALSEVVVKLAEAIGMRTVAEGVESPEQATALRLLGCHRGQGYTWSRPVPNAELREVAMRLAGVAGLPRSAT
ncbi:EAL domain-containing protein [Actinoplanes oblitus]|uniref:EAL domain-containing protein n=1 Tax=Actinoplanes oblitus TaxID=3040509 RepID=A0ABY8WRE5_9ACTN|nr:GGDEF domain-containing phosphodiesterase [Actinoplanes oblitus]WIM99663.1 EAL domain-containing protein [Actinoplanes oblitus]